MPDLRTCQACAGHELLDADNFGNLIPAEGLAQDTLEDPGLVTAELCVSQCLEDERGDGCICSI